MMICGALHFLELFHTLLDRIQCAQPTRSVSKSAAGHIRTEKAEIWSKFAGWGYRLGQTSRNLRARICASAGLRFDFCAAPHFLELY